MHFSGHDAFWLNLDTAPRKNHPIEMSGNHDAIALNLSLDFGVFAKDHGLFRNNVSLHVSVNAEGSRQCKRSFERNTPINESRPFLVQSVLRRTGPLPSHEHPPEQSAPLHRGRTFSNVASLAEKSTPQPSGVVE